MRFAKQTSCWCDWHEDKWMHGVKYSLDLNGIILTDVVNFASTSLLSFCNFCPCAWLAFGCRFSSYFAILLYISKILFCLTARLFFDFFGLSHIFFFFCSLVLVSLFILFFTRCHYQVPCYLNFLVNLVHSQLFCDFFVGNLFLNLVTVFGWILWCFYFECVNCFLKSFSSVYVGMHCQ